MAGSMIALAAIAFVSGWIHVRAILRHRARVFAARQAADIDARVAEHGIPGDTDVLADIDAEAYELWLEHERTRGSR